MNGTINENMDIGTLTKMIKKGTFLEQPHFLVYRDNRVIGDFFKVETNRADKYWCR